MTSMIDIDDLSEAQLDQLARKLRPRMSRLALGDPEQLAADVWLLLARDASKIEPPLLSTGRLTEPKMRKQWATMLARQLFADVDTSPPPPRESVPLLDLNTFKGTPREYARAVNAYASGESRSLSGVPKKWLAQFAPGVLAEIERGTGYQRTGRLDDAGDRAPGGIDWQG